MAGSSFEFPAPVGFPKAKNHPPPGERPITRLAADVLIAIGTLLDDGNDRKL
jgi:hypothetical protein